LKYSIEFIRGLSYLIEGEYEKASLHLKNAALEKSDRIEAYFAAGLVFRKNRQFDRATYVLESILRGSETDTQTKRALTIELARVMFDAGNYTIAHSLLEMSTDREAVLLRAKALRRLERFEEAANTYKMLAKNEKINLNNETGYCYYRCAVSSTGSRQNKFIRTALKFIPDSRCINMMQIDNMLAAGKASKAMVEIERFISAGLVASADDMQKFQTVFYESQRTEELMRIIMKRISEGSANPFVYTFAAARMQHGEKRDKALQILETYTEEFGFNNTVAKASLGISPNKMLEAKLKGANFYSCTECSTEFGEYSDVCPQCQSFETLKSI